MMLCVCVCVFVIVIVLVVIVVIFKNFKLCGSKNSKALHNDVRIRPFVFFLALSREPNNTLWFIIFLIL